ncbi:MAG: hypothetical protein GSR82_00830 [Desulfurococcales archaeon]|nr:hypothetical protein [Desulfurococcales archaeon]
MTILHPDLGAVEVVVNHNVDALNISKPIAATLEPIISAYGYHTVVIVRGFHSPNTTLDNLWEAFNKFSYIVIRLPMNNPANDTPTYLRQITQLQEGAIKKHQMKSYMQTGFGVYGTVGIDFWGPKPNKTEVYEMVKWIRDKAGPEYSDIPLYIIFYSEQPPKLELMTTTVPPRTAVSRPPLSIGYPNNRNRTHHRTRRDTGGNNSQTKILKHIETLQTPLFLLPG